MNIDFRLLEKRLAEQKVYDAWQYVESLHETLLYMTTSYEILLKVYEHRKDIIAATENEVFDNVIKNGQGTIGEKELRKTELDIGGFILDDTIFLRKTAIEFFQYARISMDVLFQIVNAALLGDKSYPVVDKGLLGKVQTQLRNKPEFMDLFNLLDDNRNDARFKYLSAFDNYIKHIKTVLITIKNSFLIGNTDEFAINEFCYNGIFYESVNAIDKFEEIQDYVFQTIDSILLEVLRQIPNCLDNSQRIQKINFKMQFEKGNVLEHITFFIEVDNDLSELPREIKVLPLLIKPNDEIYSFDFKFDKIFIKKKDCDETSIIGCAELKNGFETNEFYRIFEVKPCQIIDYLKYISTFNTKYQKISMNIYAMEGEMLFLS